MRAANSSLLERQAELSDLRTLADEAMAGTGGVLAITGVGGIGKSTLVMAGIEIAERTGLQVLSAACNELESSYSFGVVRQLFEPLVAGSEVTGRVLKASGPARRALDALDPHDGEAGRDHTFAVLHGLYWLAVDLCQREPLLIAVDDLQFADPASLRWLLYLSERMDGLPMSLLVSWRTGEPGPDAVLTAGFDRFAAGRVITPGNLSPDAVERLLSDRFDRLPARPVVEACHDVTGGNPFLVNELAAVLEVDGMADDVALTEVRRIAPRSIARSTVLRIGRLGAKAGELARAIAILGDGAQLLHAADLADVPLEDAADAADQLSAIGLLAPGTPLRFVHALVRTALYDDIPPVVRQLRHARAAEVLARHGSDEELICAHFLRCDPGTSVRAIEHLSAAAAQALARGAPEIAATYLARAVEESTEPHERCQLVRRLGNAEAMMRSPSASAHLETALQLAVDPDDRAAIAADLAEVLGIGGRWDAALNVAERVLAEVTIDPDRGAPAGDASAAVERLEFVWAGLAAFDPTRIEQFDRFVDGIRAAGRRGAQPAATAAVALAWRGEDPEEIARLLDGVLAEIAARGVSAAEPMLLMRTCASALTTNDLQRLGTLIDDMLVTAQGEGSAFPMVLATDYRMAMRVRRGELAAAASDLRAALELSQQHDLAFTLPPLLWYGVDALLERGELADIAALTAVDLGPELDRTSIGAVFRELRGRIAFANNNVADARRYLEEAAAVFEAMRLHNPNGSSWRSSLSLTMAGEDRPEALRLSRSELSDARRLGWPRPIGVALRCLGLVEGGSRGLAHLEEAVAILAGSDARLEYARALVTLGSALRRANKRAQAREHLLMGLDLARRCGAERLTQEARRELRAAGARPRREAVTGVESLTAAERRVAELVGKGVSNPEIARSLFVTINTVEAHLRHIFQKLSISSRRQLGAMLDTETEGTVARSGSSVME